MALDVLYEDDHVMAVNKAAGVVVHPTYKNVSDTLLDDLRSYGSAWPDGQNPTIVGRLDKGTSGLVIVAKSGKVHAQLQRALTSPESEKDYVAVVRGCVDFDRILITSPLKIDEADRRRVVVDHGGSPSETQVQRLETVGDISLLRCRLVTGRRHQIRVHLTSRGWPILGDRIYGSLVDDFPRQALHSWRTFFAHPISGERIEIVAPIPEDLRELLRGFDWRATRPKCPVA